MWGTKNRSQLIEAMNEDMCNVNLSQFGNTFNETLSDNVNLISICKLLGNLPSVFKINMLVLGISQDIQDNSLYTRFGVTISEFTVWISTRSLLSRSSAGISLQNWGSQMDLTSGVLVLTAGRLSGGSLTESMSFNVGSVSALCFQNVSMFVSCQLFSDQRN